MNSLVERFESAPSCPDLRDSRDPFLPASSSAPSLRTAFTEGEGQVNSSDATPLTIPNPVDLSNQFSKIAKEVGPAVVNISTETLPKQTSKSKLRGRGVHAPAGRTG